MNEGCSSPPSGFYGEVTTGELNAACSPGTPNVPFLLAVKGRVTRGVGAGS